ncbi:hypothetical protein [Ruegeria sp.]|uniref:hypothetical protein n=1 Tax=Ruegeria sp. TaxID=1879320 RepID=UPI003B5A9D06
MSLSLQRPETQRAADFDAGSQWGRCLTELSLPTLIAGALAVSALLWLTIYAVL